MPTKLMRRLFTALLLITCALSVPPVHAATTTAAKPSPLLYLSATTSDTAYAGWPLQVCVTLVAPPAQEAPCNLAILNAAWTAALHVQIKDARGKPADWPLHLVAATAPTLTLDAKQQGIAIWWLSPEETTQLAVGTYTLIATLDTTVSARANAWVGKAMSRPLTMTVVADPGQATPALRALRATNFAWYYLTRGEHAAALKQVDVMLADNPHSITGLCVKGSILEAMNDITGANEAVNTALDAYAALHAEEPPPPDLLQLQARLISRLLKSEENH